MGNVQANALAYPWAMSLSISANTDFRYGPWESKEAALNAIDSYTSGRCISLTVAIYDDSTKQSSTEYWFQGGITDDCLVPKDKTASSETSILKKKVLNSLEEYNNITVKDPGTLYLIKG